MKKGDLVRLNPNDPEITRILDWPFGGKDFMASRPSTTEERQAWRRIRGKLFKKQMQQEKILSPLRLMTEESHDFLPDPSQFLCPSIESMSLKELDAEFSWDGGILLAE